MSAEGVACAAGVTLSSFNPAEMAAANIEAAIANTVLETHTIYISLIHYYFLQGGDPAGKRATTERKHKECSLTNHN